MFLATILSFLNALLLHLQLFLLISLIGCLSSSWLHFQYVQSYKSLLKSLATFLLYILFILSGGMGSVTPVVKLAPLC